MAFRSNSSALSDYTGSSSYTASGHTEGSHYTNGSGYTKASGYTKGSRYTEGSRDTKPSGYTEGRRYTDGTGYTKASGYTEGRHYTKGTGYKTASGYTEGSGCTQASGYTEGSRHTERSRYTETSDGSVYTEWCCQCLVPFGPDRKIAAENVTEEKRQLICKQCFTGAFETGEISRSYIADRVRTSTTAELRLLRQNDGHPTVKVHERPAEGSPEVGSIPSGHCVRCTDSQGEFVLVTWRGLEGWVGRKNTVKNVKGPGDGAVGCGAAPAKSSNLLTVPGSAPSRSNSPNGCINLSLGFMTTARSAASRGGDRSTRAATTIPGSLKGSVLTDGGEGSQTFVPPASSFSR